MTRERIAHSGSLGFIGTKLDYCLFSNQLTNSCLIDLMDMTMDDEDACSKEAF